MGKIFEVQKKEGRLDEAGNFPKVVLIDTISYCNLKCAMCVHKEMKRNKGIMPWNLFTKIIDEIAETDKSVRVWMVFLGEALLLKRKKPTIFDMIAYAKSKELTDVVLNSNANLMDKAASKELICLGLDAIYIGIDAVQSDTYIEFVGDRPGQVSRHTGDISKIQQSLNWKPEVPLEEGLSRMIKW